MPTEFNEFDFDVDLETEVSEDAEDVDAPEVEEEPRTQSSGTTEKVQLRRGYRGVLVDPDTGDRYRKGETYEVSAEEAERLLNLSGRGGQSPFVRASS